GIWQCVNRGEVAITYDDGPSEWTKQIVRQFDEYGWKGTFFMTGDNLGRKIDDEATRYPELIRAMYASGHQIGSHGWLHKNLDRESRAERVEVMKRNEYAFYKLLGVVPAYMRPPFAVCSVDCAFDLQDLAYHIVQFNIDTLDYKHNSPTEISISTAMFDRRLADNGTGSYIVLNHDTKEWTAKTLTPYMLARLKESGYRAVTVGECL
ncbi:hypothetical protein BX600DRAFT_360097, partial [Xylariales sp. PMI_506]